MESRDRVLAGWILASASALMLYPLILSWWGQSIPMVQDLGFARGRRAPLGAWLAAVAFAGVYIGYTFWAIPFVRHQQREISAFKLLGLLAAVASGIMEEVVFRRWLMDAAQGIGCNEAFQVLVSAVAFGLAHLSWHAFNFDWRFSLPAGVATTVAGGALAAIYLLAERSLGPCILAHMLINAVIEPWLVLAAVGQRRQSGQSVASPPNVTDGR